MLAYGLPKVCRIDEPQCGFAFCENAGSKSINGSNRTQNIHGAEVGPKIQITNLDAWIRVVQEGYLF